MTRQEYDSSKDIEIQAFCDIITASDSGGQATAWTHVCVKAYNGGAPKIRFERHYLTRTGEPRQNNGASLSIDEARGAWAHVDAYLRGTMASSNVPLLAQAPRPMAPPLPRHTNATGGPAIAHHVPAPPLTAPPVASPAPRWRKA